MTTESFRKFPLSGVLFLLSMCLVFISSHEAIAGDLTVEWEWKSGHKCYYKSPQINLTGVPDSTVKFSVKMVDLDMTSFNHGGGKVDNDGSGVIREGALSYYKGPCPPAGGHQYEITVNAMDASGSMIAKGKAVRSCCSQF